MNEWMITLQSRCSPNVVVGQLLVAALPFPSLSLAGYINSNNYRGHSYPGCFLLKLNSLTRYRCHERSMTKNKLIGYLWTAIDTKILIRLIIIIILAYTRLHTFWVSTHITDSSLSSFSRHSLGNDRPNDTVQMHSDCPYIVIAELMVPALPSSDYAGYINPNIEVT